MSYEDRCSLAYLIYLQFDRDLDAGAAAYGRMMQAVCHRDYFRGMVEFGSRRASK